MNPNLASGREYCFYTGGCWLIEVLYNGGLLLRTNLLKLTIFEFILPFSSLVKPFGLFLWHAVLFNSILPKAVTLMGQITHKKSTLNYGLHWYEYELYVTNSKV